MTATLAAPDVRQLDREQLPRAEFPAGRAQEFRVYLDPGVHEQIHKHAAEDVSVEICGVLVGDWGRDGDGPFVAVTESIRCDNAASKFAEVTLTHASWAKINEEMDTRFSHLRIVGWYHSHPDFGIFLSERDRFIQEHFFSAAGQIACVVDPVRKTEGIFMWRDGKPTLCPHYWVGGRIYTALSATASDPPAPAQSSASGQAGEHRSAGNADRLSLSPILIRGLAWVAIFLIGYLLALKGNAWERQRLAEGAVVHYGVWKGLRPGLGEALTAVNDELTKTAERLAPLSKNHISLAGEDADATRKEWQQVHRSIEAARQALEHVKATYSLTPEEAAAVNAVIAAKIAEMRGIKTENGNAKVP